MRTFISCVSWGCGTQRPRLVDCITAQRLAQNSPFSTPGVSEQNASTQGWCTGVQQHPPIPVAQLSTQTSPKPWLRAPYLHKPAYLQRLTPCGAPANRFP